MSPKKKRQRSRPNSDPATPRTTRILVPVDFSDHSQSVLRWIAHAELPEATSLILIHVVHDPGDAPGYYATGKKQTKHLTRLEEAAADMFAAFVESLPGEIPELERFQIETRLVVGLPVNRILEVATLERVDHIVMGSQGRTGLPSLLLGSKAERVVRLAPVPVTIVKQWPLETPSTN